MRGALSIAKVQAVAVCPIAIRHLLACLPSKREKGWVVPVTRSRLVVLATLVLAFAAIGLGRSQPPTQAANPSIARQLSQIRFELQEIRRDTRRARQVLSGPDQTGNGSVITRLERVEHIAQRTCQRVYDIHYPNEC